MFNPNQSDDYRPLFWVSGRPVYVNTLLVALHVFAFAALAVVTSFDGGVLLQSLSLGNYEVLHGQIWRLVTNVVFAPLSAWDAINFVFAMGFLFYFGRQVEEFIGRRAYIKFCIALVLIPSLLACLLGPAGFWIEGYYNGYGPIFGVIVAFATIYPGVEINIWFVNLAAKYWAFVLLGVLSLYYVASHSWILMAAFWCNAAIGYFGMRLLGAGYGLTWLTDWWEERRAARLARQHNIRVLKETKATESIDEILDKISQHGVDSLSAKERAALERARANLLKRDQR
jgi:membrane associated rhomboid family serine protease